MLDYLIKTTSIHCPYCGESIELLIDCSMPQQGYIEDCSVCCRPISLSIAVNEKVTVIARSENE